MALKETAANRVATLKKEVWYQDAEDPDLWVSEQGLIVNTAALNERAPFFELICVPQASSPERDLKDEYSSP